MTKKILVSLIAFNLVLIIAGLIYGVITYKKIFVKSNKVKSQLNSQSSIPTPTPDPLRPYSILLMGYGGGKHDGGRLTDSIMVARVEPKNKSVTLISIPRDLWVPVPVSKDSDKHFKINASYAIGSDDKKYGNKSERFTGAAGGGEMAKHVIGNVLGFNIDYFIALDFQGFVKTVDILGGVKVPVQKTFDDYFYPIEGKENDNCGKNEDEIKAMTATLSGSKLEEAFICRFEHLHFDKGTQLMDGETALKYVRSRHSPQDGGDFNRAARQRVMIQSVKDRVINIGFISKIIPFINTLAGNLQTDMDIPKIEEFISESTELSQYEINSIALTDQNVLMQGKSSDGQFILLPRDGEDTWTGIQEYINNPQVTVTPTKTSTSSGKLN